MLHSLYIVNKSGGLMYHRDLSPTAKFADNNEYLQAASTFHSLILFSKQLAPVPSGGITSVDAPTFSLYCYTSPTGVEFFVTAKPARAGAAGAAAAGSSGGGGGTGDLAAASQAFLRRVYEFYADYVLKNPFYEIDQPIRVPLFEAAIDKTVRDAGLGVGGVVAATTPIVTSGGGGGAGTGGAGAASTTAAGAARA